MGINNKRFSVMIERACWKFISMSFAEDRRLSLYLRGGGEEISNVLVIALYQTTVS